MEITTSELKKSMEKQKHKGDDLVTQVFNRGIDTAIKVVEIYESVNTTAVGVK